MLIETRMNQSDLNLKFEFLAAGQLLARQGQDPARAACGQPVLVIGLQPHASNRR